MELGEKLELQYRVQTKDLARELSLDEQDDFPEVFATSRMIALMELAAARLMKPLLADDELSVGVNVTVNHLAATPNDQDVRAVAVFSGMVGKLYKFAVEVHDSGGKVGDGTHTRAIVSTERLVSSATNRVNS